RHGLSYGIRQKLVGCSQYRQVRKCMMQNVSNCTTGFKSLQFSNSQFRFVVENLNNVAGHKTQLAGLVPAQPADEPRQRSGLTVLTNPQQPMEALLNLPHHPGRTICWTTLLP
ncbi:MAG: hypothetical protein RLP45_07430, partial [Haliea sp.]